MDAIEKLRDDIRYWTDRKAEAERNAAVAATVLGQLEDALSSLDRPAGEQIASPGPSDPLVRQAHEAAIAMADSAASKTTAGRVAAQSGVDAAVLAARKALGTETFTAPDISAQLESEGNTMPRSTVRGALLRLAEAGSIRVREQGAGRRATVYEGGSIAGA